MLSSFAGYSAHCTVDRHACLMERSQRALYRDPYINRVGDDSIESQVMGDTATRSSGAVSSRSVRFGPPFRRSCCVAEARIGSPFRNLRRYSQIARVRTVLRLPVWREIREQNARKKRRRVLTKIKSATVSRPQITPYPTRKHRTATSTSSLKAHCIAQLGDRTPHHLHRAVPPRQSMS
jgi:hypothetical protein